MFKNLAAYLVFILFIASCAATPLGNANNEQGMALAAERQWEEALKFFLKAALENPQEPTYQNNIGKIYQRLGDFENSSKYLIKAIDLSPTYYMPRNTLRVLYMENGRLGELVKYYESRAAKTPNKNVELAELGLLYSHDERFKDAIRVTSKAIINEKNKKDLKILKNNLNIMKEMDIGITRYNDGSYPEALAALNKAKKLIVGDNNPFVIEKYLDLTRSKLKKSSD